MRRTTRTTRTTSPTGPAQVAAYIAAAPVPARPMLRTLRAIVRSAAPDADETLSYRMPYYRQHGRLVYFAAFKEHVGVYLMGRSKERFAKQIAPWRTSKSTLRFEFGSKLPVALLERILRARVKENLAAAAAKRRPGAARA